MSTPDPSQPAVYFAHMQTTEGWRVILESFARFVAPPEGASVLDIGCSAGALVSIFEQNFPVKGSGVDADPTNIRLTTIRGQMCIGALPTLPYRDGTWDVVTATNVIYLLNNPANALREMVRILKPGGILAMLNPSEKMSIKTATMVANSRELVGFARDNLIMWGQMAETKPRWTAEDARALLQSVGLTLSDTQERIGEGLVRYVKGIKA